MTGWILTALFLVLSAGFIWLVETARKRGWWRP